MTTKTSTDVRSGEKNCSPAVDTETDKEDRTMSTAKDTEHDTDRAERVTEDQGDQGDQGDQDANPGKEAAKYRRRLRDTETERDTLRGQVEALQRAEVERLAGHLTQPSAIWAAGVELADVLDDSGAVNADKVATAVTEAAEALGLARAPRTPRPDPSQGGARSSGPTGPEVLRRIQPATMTGAPAPRGVGRSRPNASTAGEVIRSPRP